MTNTREIPQQQSVAARNGRYEYTAAYIIEKIKFAVRHLGGARV